MKIFRVHITICILLFVCFTPSYSQEKVDLEMINKIREEGFKHSQVMDMASMMSDVYGPRFSNSPAYNESAKWAVKRYQEYGIDAKMEAYGEVGVGWTNKYTSAHMHEPQYMTLNAFPVPYAKGTNGKVNSEAIHINIELLKNKKDLKQYKGMLNGKIILIAPERKLDLHFEPAAVRLSKEELNDMAELKILPEVRERRERKKSEGLNQEEIFNFFEKEGALVLVKPSSSQGSNLKGDNGIVVVNSGAPISVDAKKSMPQLIISTEHYNRMVRIIEQGFSVKMEVEIKVEFDEKDLVDYNVIAEIPGTDLKDEYVLIGGHYDGESSATGATDNAAGAASVMEAMRILKAIDAKPRRTIRAALWGCEEAGTLGSKAYVNKHLFNSEKEEKLENFDKISAYFNMDWYGKFRGIFLQGNDLVRPIFEEWMVPFHDVGMTYLIPGNTCCTDHMPFVRAGLPGFQFLQDDLEYFTTTWHTNMDFYDRLVEEDLIQASVILAVFAYNTAMRDEMLPRTDNQKNNNRRWHK